MGPPSNISFVFNYFVTLSSCLIGQIISFILSPNEYGCVLRLNNAVKYCERSTYRRCRFWQKKKSSFQMNGYVNKQNCRIWGTENPYPYFGADFGPDA